MKADAGKIMSLSVNKKLKHRKSIPTTVNFPSCEYGEKTM